MGLKARSVIDVLETDPCGKKLANMSGGHKQTFFSESWRMIRLTPTHHVPIAMKVY
jgi:hypothetical protein